jgi:hypothetical protein
MFIEPIDIAHRLKNCWMLRIETIELVGEEKQFGYLLVDNRVKLGIWISDEEKIMDVIQDFMCNTGKLMEKISNGEWS